MNKRKVRKVKAYLRGWLYGSLDRLSHTDASTDDIRIALSDWNLRVQQQELPHCNWKWVGKMIRKATNEFKNNSPPGLSSKFEEVIRILGIEKVSHDNKTTKGD